MPKRVMDVELRKLMVKDRLSIEFESANRVKLTGAYLKLSENWVPLLFVNFHGKVSEFEYEDPESQTLGMELRQSDVALAK
jgi:hypothetical protein